MRSLSTMCRRTLATVALLAAAAVPSHTVAAGAPAKTLGAFDGRELVQVQDRRGGGPAMRGGGPAARGGPAIGGGQRFGGQRFGGQRFGGQRFRGGPRFSGRQFRGDQFARRGGNFRNRRFAGRFHSGRFHNRHFHGGSGYWPYFAAAPYLYDYGYGYSYCERVLEPRLTRNGIVMRWVRRCPGYDDYYHYW